MLINFNHLKTFSNAFLQKMKDFRGNWNQNDPTADDYIKNRPFYSENSEAIILKETQLTFDGGISDIEAPVTLEAGRTYKITYNGITYECVAVNSASLERSTLGVMPLAAAVTEIVIGNFALLMGAGDTGEPFCMINYPGEALDVLDVNGAESATVDIKEDVEIVHKLDKKFIDMPDGIVTEESLYPILENNLAPVAFSNNYDSLSGKPTIYTDVVRYGNSQSLTTTQKIRAKSNINAVGYDAQTLTETQKAQARNNIGAGTSDFSGNYFDLENKPCDKIITDDVSIVSEAVITPHSVDWSLLDRFELGTEILSYSKTYTVIINNTTYTGLSACYASSTQITNGRYLGNASLLDSSAINTGEPFVIYTYINPTSQDLRFKTRDNSLIGTPITVSVIQEGATTYIPLETDYIPDSVLKYSKNKTAKIGYTWDENIEGRDCLIFGNSRYYKVDDCAFNVSDIISIYCIGSNMMNVKSYNYTIEGFYISEGVVVTDRKGYFEIRDESLSRVYRVNAPSAGVYLYYANNSSHTNSATITYKPNAIPSDVVGLVRTINGNEPDVNGNIEYGPDWNASESENGYIKNRTHYEYLTTIEQPVALTASAGEQIVVVKNVSPETTTDLRVEGYGIRPEFIEKDTTHYIYKDSTITVRITFVEGDNGQCDAHWLLTPTSDLNIIAYHTFKEVHQLDEKYIPDTIARKSDIPNDIGVQPDWNQSDETAPDYIKNKPIIAYITIPEIDAICIIPLEAGLYQDGIMVMSWDELVANGAFQTEALTESGYLMGHYAYNPPIIGELVITKDTGVTTLSYLADYKKIIINSDILTQIDSAAFVDCTNLTEVDLSSKITCIPTNAFLNCTNLQKVILPQSVTRIDEKAFSNCTSLTDIIFKGTMSEWETISKYVSVSPTPEEFTWNYLVPATQVICSDGTITL